MGNRLEKAFRADHRVLIRGLHRLRGAIAANDLRRAREIAGELDAGCGAHMAFEETVLYPALRPVLGTDYVARLYREHATGRTAVAEVVGLPDSARLDDDRRKHLLADLDETLQHAVSCGTLLSYIERFGEDEIGRLEIELSRLELRAPRWTDLPLPREGGA